jgi:hypothetical protein
MLQWLYAIFHWIYGILHPAPDVPPDPLAGQGVIIMSGLTGTWTECLYKNAAVGAQAAVNTTEAQLNTTATMGPQPVLPAGFFTSRPQAIGQAIRIVARGVLSTTTGPPTFGILVRANAAVNSIAGNVWLGTSSTAAVTISQTNVYWELEGTVTVSIMGSGANSTVRGVGRMISPALTTPFITTAWGGQASPGTVASVDLTVPYYLSVSYVSSSASNSCSLNEFEVYGLN